MCMGERQAAALPGHGADRCAGGRPGLAPGRPPPRHPTPPPRTGPHAAATLLRLSRT